MLCFVHERHFDDEAEMIAIDTLGTSGVAQLEQLLPHASDYLSACIDNTRARPWKFCSLLACI